MSGRKYPDGHVFFEDTLICARSIMMGPAVFVEPECMGTSDGHDVLAVERGIHVSSYVPEGAYRDLMRLLQQSYVLLDVGRKRLGDVEVTSFWSEDVLKALPQVKEFLEALNSDTDAGLKKDSLASVEWLMNQGSD